MYCASCKQNHSNIKDRDLIPITKAFIEGDAQIVTGRGVETLCLLDIMDRKTQRKVRPSERSYKAA